MAILLVTTIESTHTAVLTIPILDHWSCPRHSAIRWRILRYRVVRHAMMLSIPSLLILRPYPLVDPGEMYALRRLHQLWYGAQLMPRTSTMAGLLQHLR